MKKILKFDQYITESTIPEIDPKAKIVQDSIENLTFLSDSGYNLKGNELVERINAILNGIWQHAKNDTQTRHILETQRKELVAMIEIEYLIQSQ